MDDYFALANDNPIAQGIMGRARLEGSAKLWWKLHCQTQGKARKFCGMGRIKEKSQRMVSSTQLLHSQNEQISLFY